MVIWFGYDGHYFGSAIEMVVVSVLVIMVVTVRVQVIMVAIVRLMVFLVVKIPNKCLVLELRK